MDLITTLILLGIVQGLFLGLLFFLIESPYRRANRFLGALFISFSVSISHFFLFRSDLYQTFPHLTGTSFPALFLFGPLFYFYVLLLTNRLRPLTPRDTLHLLPFLSVVAAMSPLYLSTAEVKLEYAASVLRRDVLASGLILGFLQIMHLSAYLVAVRKVLVAYEDRIRQTRSSIEQISLRWLWTGVRLFVFVFAIMLGLMILQVFGIDMLEVYALLIPLIVTIVIFLLGVLAFRQRSILSPSEEALTAQKYEKSSITPERASAIRDRLEEVLRSQKPFLDPDLTLPRLADMVQVPGHQLSQVINETMGTTFFELVNRFRIEEAKRFLKDPKTASYTILAIAEESGFNSKTAFNNAFKKMTGMTPSEFRDSQA
jgi:AraC-like DNA-binding protein